MFPLIVLAGPTGVGKTAVAIELAERLGGEIVGADSRQIYREMDIGTAKPTPAERARVPHHLIDIRNPDGQYSAAEYARDAATVIQEIHARGKIPLLVGGTGLYIHAVLYGMFAGPERDDTFRSQMTNLASAQGTAFLHQQLAQVDPETARRVHPHDLMRILRALEVYHLTGTPISNLQAHATTPLVRYQTCFLILTMPRPALYARIHTRVDLMIAQGLIAEVRRLLERGYHVDLPALNSVGYQEVGEFLQHRRDLPATIALIKQNSRRYAKRQLTWFRKYPEGIWIGAERSAEALDQRVEACLQSIQAFIGQARECQSSAEILCPGL